VSALACCCPVDLSVVSRHLSILREAGIVEAKRHGKEVHYEVRYDVLARTFREIGQAIEQCCPDRPGPAGDDCRG
jgi:ArsR family transcriptional regulator